MNLRRREHIAEAAAARRQVALVEKEIQKLVQAIKDGFSAVSIKNELLKLEERKAELTAAMTAAGRKMPGRMAVANVGCGGVQPAVLAAVERGGVRHRGMARVYESSSARANAR